MPLVLAIKNKNNLVVATDASGPATAFERFGQFMPMSSHAALLMAGNLEAVRHAIADVVAPKVRAETSAATLAQLVQAALVLEVVPTLAQVKGRIEIIVAGFDPIRHIEDPGLYYMDSAQDFYLKIVAADSVAAGSTAAAAPLLASLSYASASVEQMEAVAKECFATTKLRWPEAVESRVRLGVISPGNIQVKDL